MAKGLRASTRKRNNANLRAKVFGPAVDARTERLSAKLLELAAQPKPKPEDGKVMELDSEQGEREEDGGVKVDKDDKDMDVDEEEATTKVIAKRSKKQKASRIEKKIVKRKPRNSIVFPPNARQKKRMASKGKKS